ncbi:glycosyltransferase family 2 protein [Falsiruegeria mediterranea]|uniref:glycosyltransferase family 2 protein n=1 Tax=Falsiruegeria mediterranea TaxID=1280832 RepID=UPI0015F25C4A|nr:glycosyltransferase family 2 protein [Falsiruegeria mediterranea]
MRTSQAQLSENDGVCILLGLYQGARFLQEQLDSFAAQSWPHWSLIVSDDGSRDQGPEIVADFAAAHPDRQITCRSGPQQGFVRNFQSLLQAVPPDVPYAALSDQDDVWFPDKIERALTQLAALPAEVPALYCARTLICDEDLTPMGPSPHFPRTPGFRNALVQSIGGGNTMVLNRAALDLVATCIHEEAIPVAHDWWLYQVVSGCGGTIVRDPDPVLSYRQHAHNQIGANLSARAQMARLVALLGGQFRSWSATNLAALAGLEPQMTPDAHRVLQHFAQARRGGIVRRLSSLRQSGVYRQGRLGDIALYMACVLNRL